MFKSISGEYSWEILDQLSWDNLPLQFPRNPQDYSKDYVVHFWSKDGKDWVGNFHGIDKQYFTGVVLWPKVDHLCIVSGGAAYVVKMNDPDTFEELSIGPITDALYDLNTNIVVFASFTNIYGFGERGFLWKTPRMAIDGIKIKEISNGIILGISNNIDEGVPFSLDVKTGKPTK